MGRLAAIALLVLCSGVAAAGRATGAGRTAGIDALLRARQLYNDGDFEGALGAAEQARLVPSRAVAAALVAARAYLERFRLSADDGDLANARLRLRRLDPIRFDARERVE